MSGRMTPKRSSPCVPVRIFETAQDKMETDTDGGDVIGLMLHGYATAWSRPAGDDFPRLKSLVVERRTLYAQDETTEEFRLAESFFDACTRKRDQRLREIWSGGLRVADVRSETVPRTDGCRCSRTRHRQFLAGGRTLLDETAHGACDLLGAMGIWAKLGHGALHV